MPVLNANVLASIETPDGTKIQLQLHNSNGDGIYKRYLSVQKVGRYRISITSDDSSRNAYTFKIDQSK
jgi:hypothetical protein